MTFRFACSCRKSVPRSGPVKGLNKFCVFSSNLKTLRVRIILLKTLCDHVSQSPIVDRIVWGCWFEGDIIDIDEHNERSSSVVVTTTTTIIDTCRSVILTDIAVIIISKPLSLSFKREVCTGTIQTEQKDTYICIYIHVCDWLCARLLFPVLPNIQLDSIKYGDF